VTVHVKGLYYTKRSGLWQSQGWAWALLPARTLLFAAWQAVFALGFLLSGSLAACDASAA
jgi:hypothetical protein